MKAIVFLGGGHITGALAAGLRLAGYRGEIVVYDRHPEKVRGLRRESQVTMARDLKSAVERTGISRTGSSRAGISRAGMLVIAVRPGSVEEILHEVVASGASVPGLCVSLAAGIPLRNLRRWLGPPVRWARAMPSPVCRMARGLTPVSFDRSVAESERARVRRLFGYVGPVLDLPERQLDAITAAHSPTHGYHALATLAKAAEEAGLDRATALTAAAHALGDGIFYWRESGKALGDLLREAATPGGIAAATMAAMDASGYARVVRNGIRAGVRRARLNARR
jgi:pyrroline-5-carboxylate reductase